MAAPQSASVLSAGQRLLLFGVPGDARRLGPDVAAIDADRRLCADGHVGLAGRVQQRRGTVERTVSGCERGVRGSAGVPTATGAIRQGD